MNYFKSRHTRVKVLTEEMHLIEVSQYHFELLHCRCFLEKANSKLESGIEKRKFLNQTECV
jgi:hypothetical protein